mgnify:FL=1
MATTFTWSINNLERLSSNDGIRHADWICAADETVGGKAFTARVSGKTHHTPDPSASDFIAYADVTEANVLGWVQAALIQGTETAAEAKTRIEAMAQVKLDEKKTPPAKTGMPW